MASKHAVIGLTKTLTLEYVRLVILHIFFSPEVIQTPMIERLTGKTKLVIEQFKGLEPLGRFGLAQETENDVI